MAGLTLLGGWVDFLEFLLWGVGGACVSVWFWWDCVYLIGFVGF